MEYKNKRRCAFDDMHPAVALAYYTVMLAIGMTMLHPIMLIATIVGAISLYARLVGARKACALFGLLVLVVIASSVINPIFNHRGVTILFYGIGSNPVTLEAIVYGVVSGTMLAGAIAVFASLSLVMTEDKIVYLFGRITPSFALLLSMTLRFASVMKERITQAFSAQSCFYRESNEKKHGIAGKLRLAFAVVSATIGHIIESSLEAANSMRARGYGLKGRSSCKTFTLTMRDKIVLAVILVLTLLAFGCIALGGARAMYYPRISFSSVEGASMSVYIAYAVISLLPTIINCMEDFKWKRIESKI